MSIRIMSEVWERSNAKGAELLLLLAIADYANDTGKAWPSINTLSKKCRVGERYVIKLLQKLEERGELVINHRAGYRANNIYFVTISTSEPQGTSEPEGSSEPQDTRTSEPQFTSLVNPSSPDPSITTIDPSYTTKVKKVDQHNGKGKTAPKKGLTTGQRYWLDAFGAKRFANNIQKAAVLALEQEHGTDTLKEGVTWAAKQGMGMGKALTSLETALPKWGNKGKSSDKVIKVGR